LGFVQHDAAWLADHLHHHRAVPGADQPQPTS
jgi:hypothetical protein